MMKLKIALATGMAAAFVAGCASTPTPRQEHTQASGSLRAAEAIGADRHARASVYLRNARDKVRRAERLMDEGDNAEARRVLERAHLDAELAIALTQAADAREDARQAMADVQDAQRRLR